MSRKIREGHDVVIASRFRPGARVYGVPLHRRFLSLAACWLMRLSFPFSGIRDFTCGYRAYRCGALKVAVAHYGDRLVDAEGFQCMVDILLKLHRLGMIVGEVPVILRYDLKEGKSKMRVLATVRGTLAVLYRRRFGLP
jgi:dolichol-phosphate mannosyltransferase